MVLKMMLPLQDSTGGKQVFASLLGSVNEDTSMAFMSFMIWIGMVLSPERMGGILLMIAIGVYRLVLSTIMKMRTRYEDEIEGGDEAKEEKSRSFAPGLQKEWGILVVATMFGGTRLHSPSPTRPVSDLCRKTYWSVMLKNDGWSGDAKSRKSW